MTRVLQIMAGARVGGAEGFFMRLTPALAKAGVEQQAVIRQHPDRAATLQKAAVTTHQLRFGGPIDLITPYRLNRIAREFDPDIALCWMNRAANIAPKGRQVNAARLGGYYSLKYYRRCKHLVGNTKDICDYLIRSGWPREQVWYLPNFADAERMPAASRSDLNTPEDAPLLLGLGRLHRNKAFDLGLEVLARVPNAYYWIAGDGPLKDDLTAQAERLGVTDRVRFLGWRTDTAALLAASDIFLCTSRHEPLGNIVIEAWAHSTPVVAAASQGPTQLIEDGRTGRLTPVDDADSMANAVKELIASPAQRQDLAEKAFQAYELSFSETVVIQQYLDFFDRIRG